MKPKPFHLAGLLAVLLPILTVCQSRAELPPEAQEAMKKGIIAAKEQDYLLATRYFQDARKVAPDSPEIYYNLGLAESKIPGRELRAIAWFGAYLAATTNAPNATAIKDQIDALDVKSQSNLSHLIQSVQDACSKLPANPRDYYLQYIPALWAGVGDMTAALKTADLIEDASYKEAAKLFMAIAQADAGDIVGAQTNADLTQDAVYKSDIQLAVVKAQVIKGAIADALKTIDLMQNTDRKNDALFLIAEAQLKTGDIDGALKTANLIPATIDPYHKTLTYDYIIDGQIEIGDVEGALKSIDLIQNAFDKNWDLVEIVEAQIKTADIPGAQRTADLIISEDKDSIESGVKCEAQLAIADAHVTTGDIADAQKTLAAAQTLGRLAKDPRKSEAEAEIAGIQAKGGDISGGSKDR